MDLLTTAPGGVAKLRELILNLAIQGKLVPQDPGDEPAGRLLKTIQTQKDWLIAEGKIRRNKPQARIAQHEKPFALPLGWEWVRFGALLPFRIGKTPSSKDPRYWAEQGHAWVSIADMSHFGEVFTTRRRLTAQGAESFGYEPLPAGTLIMSFKLTIGKISVLRVPAYHNEAIVSLLPLGGLLTDFLKYMLPTVSKTGAIKDALMGATLNTESLSNLLIALPPVAEQSRIVSRIEEFMRLCDALEAKAPLEAAQHTRIVETLLGQLANSATAQESVSGCISSAASKPPGIPDGDVANILHSGAMSAVCALPLGRPTAFGADANSCKQTLVSGHTSSAASKPPGIPDGDVANLLHSGAMSAVCALPSGRPTAFGADANSCNQTLVSGHTSSAASKPPGIPDGDVANLRQGTAMSAVCALPSGRPTAFGADANLCNQTLATHFDLLFDRPEAVDALEQTLLQLAVRGLLVPQDPSEEPASRLLQRIHGKNDRLIAAGKRRLDKTLAPPGQEEQPFSLPQGWEWARIGTVAAISSGVILGRKTSISAPVLLPYLRVANVQRWRLNLSSVKQIVIDQSELERFQVVCGDLLITEGGNWDKVGRTAMWRDELPVCLHQNHVFRVRGTSPDWNPVWAELYLNSGTARAYFAAASKQTTNLASINMTQLKHCPFPVPPLAEQVRIVTRVQALHRLCADLRQCLTTRQSVQTRLAEALLESVGR